MQKKNGFTLIEVLVSVGVIGVLSILIVQSFFSTLRNNTKTELMKDLKQNGDYAMQTMVRMIQNAEQISDCSDTHSLSVVNLDGFTTVFASYPNNSVCKISSTSAMTTYDLTSDNVTMTYPVSGSCTDAITFACDSIAGVPSKVTINFTLVQKGSSPDSYERASVAFQNAAIIRNHQ